MHERSVYGPSGGKWDLTVAGLCRWVGSEDVLDYGCGVGALGRNLAEVGISIREYDPAVRGRDEPPGPADVVACTDVLEHVEPDRLRDVVQHIRSLTRVALLAAISTRLAGKTLPDGRNAHLIVRDGDWWRRVLVDGGFKIRREWGYVGEWSAWCVPATSSRLETGRAA